MPGVGTEHGKALVQGVVERPAAAHRAGCRDHAAIDAAVGLGLYPDFASAVAGMTRVGRVFEPIEGNRAIYDRLYREVYRKMYRNLQPLYRRIADITGYPRQL